MRPITLLVVHHSATPDGVTLSWQAIRRYHTEERGWKGIGYHYGVELVNGSYETLVGRRLVKNGAHAPPHNHDSIGICLVGNFDETDPPDPQLMKAACLVKDLMTVFRLDIESVVGHRDVTPGRTCPGRKFSMELFRSVVQDLL